MDPVRFGLVGYGFGGRWFHAPLLASAPEVEFRGRYRGGMGESFRLLRAAELDVAFGRADWPGQGRDAAILRVVSAEERTTSAGDGSTCTMARPPTGHAWCLT